MGTYYYDKTSETTLENRVEELETSLETVNESYGDAVRALMAMDNPGWEVYSYANAEHGFTLGQMQFISRQLREWTDTNPLLKSGHQVRSAFMFGAGYKVDTNGDVQVSKRIQHLIDDQVNQDALFSEEALSVNEHARYCDGILLVEYNKTTNHFQRIPLWQITEFVTNPGNIEQIWYYHRSYTSQVIDPATGQIGTQEYNYWYITDNAEAQGAPKVSQINGIQVLSNCVLLDDHPNRKSGATLGVPDAFTPAPWAIAYSKYLRDGSQVLASLALFAWKLAPKSKRGGDTAGAKVKATHGAGGTMVSDMDMQSLPRANAVDLTTGRPLAAQVAASLGVDLVVLLADAGDTTVPGPIINSADPQVRILQQRQKANGNFMVRALRLLGVKDPCILWGKMTPDADFREMQTVVAAQETGMFHAEETRGRIADLAGITIKKPKPPKGYMIPNNKNSFNQIDAQYQGQAGPGGTEVEPASPAQPGGGTKANGTKKTAKPSGSGTTNTKGSRTKVNTAKPSYGVNDLRGTGGRAK